MDRTIKLAQCAIFVALMIVSAYISIPTPFVPLTFQTVVAVLAGILLGPWYGSAAVAVYVLMGLIGFPVFAHGGGFVYVVNLTFGYLIGFIPMAIICGFAFEKFSNRGMQIAGLAIGTIVAYIFGTAWLAIEAHLTFYQALLAGVIPYIPGDLVKIILVVLVGPIVKKRLQSAGLLL